MNGKDLRIKIVAGLNLGKSLGDINKDIKALEKSVKRLNLKIELDDKVRQTLANFTKAMEKHKGIAQDLNRVMHEEKVITKDANGVVRESIRQHLKDGDVRTKNIKRINEQTKATKEQTEETRKLIVETDKLRNKQKQVTNTDSQGKFSGGSINTGDRFKNTTISYNANNEITNQRTTENIKQQNQAVENLRQKLQQLGNEGKITTTSLARMNTAINGAQTEKEINRIEQALNRVNQRAVNNNNLDIFRRQAQLNAQNIQRTHGGHVDNAQIQAYLNSVNALTSRTPNLTQRMRELNIQFREISANARTAAGATQQAGASFGHMMSQAMTKFPINLQVGIKLF